MVLLFSGVSLLIFGFGILCFVDEAEFRKFLSGFGVRSRVRSRVVCECTVCWRSIAFSFWCFARFRGRFCVFLPHRWVFACCSVFVFVVFLPWSGFSFCAWELSRCSSRFCVLRFSPFDAFCVFSHRWFCWILAAWELSLSDVLLALRFALFSHRSFPPSLSPIALYIRGYCVSCEIRKGEAEVVEFCVVVDACCFLLKLTTVLA